MTKLKTGPTIVVHLPKGMLKSKEEKEAFAREFSERAGMLPGEPLHVVEDEG